MRLLFKLLDYVLAILMGVASLWLVSLVVGSGWNMFVAMLVGMFVGMLVVLPALIISCSFSTAFHVMPVGMLITMLTGMMTGMAIAMNALTPSQLYPLAIFIAATVQLAMDRQDLKLKGEVALD